MPNRINAQQHDLRQRPEAGTADRVPETAQLPRPHRPQPPSTFRKALPWMIAGGSTGASIGFSLSGLLS